MTKKHGKIKKPPRIALFIGKLGGGGAERIFVEYANGLSENGLDVHLISLKGGEYERYVVPKVTLHKLRVRMRIALPFLYRRLRQLKPDALLSGLTGANFIAVIAGCLSRVPNIWISVHSDLSQAWPQQKSLINQCQKRLIQLSGYLSHGVIAVSYGVSKFLNKHININNDKIRVIHNPIAIEDITKLADFNLPDQIGRELQGSEYIVGAGRLVPLKGFDLLLSAFAQAFPPSSTIKLVLLGEGPQKDPLKTLARNLGVADRVVMPGFVENPFSVFAEAKVLVLSSRWEGFGNVIVEALACGTPVIAFDCKSGPREIINGIPGCHLIPPGDIDALSHQLSKTVKESNKFKKELVLRAMDFSRNKIAQKVASEILGINKV